jgi:hypothetical protein
MMLFNPQPQLQALTLAPGQTCWLIDDVLRDPQGLRDWTIKNRAHFQPAPFNAYPGVEMPMPADISRQLAEFFDLHLRRHFNAKRTLQMNSRMAMVTLAPEQLQARQWICHRDSAWVDPQHCIAASVLYLFDDPALGGTDFYAPKKPINEIELMVHDASTLSNEKFEAKHPFPRNYYQGPDDYFSLLAKVPAKFNRMIFYDGRIFHCGDIREPQRMTADPAVGRLTLNGFFTCSRKAV